MIVLAVESSAHTFGIGIFDGKNKKIVANARDVFSTEQGGMIPTKVAEHHIAVKEKMVRFLILGRGWMWIFLGLLQELCNCIRKVLQKKICVFLYKRRVLLCLLKLLNEH